MLIDLTLLITPRMLEDAKNIKNPALEGHLGTHFDVMDKEFPLAYTERKAIVFDVSGIFDRDIEASDIDMNLVEKDMFVAFYSAFPEREEYGGKTYFTAHPQLSPQLIDALLEKGISIIGIDFGGIRRTPEHIPADRRCADRDVFVIENLRNLEKLLALGGRFTACTYPINCTGITGLPCRVIGKV